ncbi:unnamed protein product [Bursaphelenchus xylophilus]|uniref:(pine wood nematode) hypothetical protein n=1 Tax=Bursaphelenchus xylophilus TaxID=6326 RepID=A0A1I7S3K3_BURXY|nr:unnamed protein product [Bursaphelenchus xylophilus]CAG9116370.1 unnamed protein product [Bursaphelenchus xylophilus]
MDTVAETEEEKCYFQYDEKTPTAINRYRIQSDIVADCIIQSRSEGIGRYEIGKRLGLNTRTKAGNRRVSQSIQFVVKNYPEQIGQYQKMEGKFRMLKYYYKSEGSAPTALAQLFKKAESIAGKPFPFKTGEIIKFPETNLNTLRISDVTVQRMIIILELIRDEGLIVTISRLCKHIAAKEAESGYKFVVDKKSVVKCLYALERKQLCNILTMEDVYEDDMTVNVENELIARAHTIQIVVPVDITSVEDERVKEGVNKTIAEFHSEGRVFPTGHLRFSKKSDPGTVKPKLSQVDVSNVDFHNLEIPQRAALLRYNFEASKKTKDSESDCHYDPNVSYGYQAKMTRCSIMHEFIYHVIHEVEETPEIPCFYHRFPPGKPLPVNANGPTPLDKLPVVDDSSDSPYRYVVGIPPFKNIQRGWFMLRDIVLGMPLSLFCMVINVREKVAGLEEYLSDPVKRHLPLADLPADLRRVLFTKKACSLAEHICLTLCALGHMRVAPSFDNGRTMIGPTSLFFCGKKTYIYDTSTSERGYSSVTLPIDRYKKYDYEFKSSDDVYRYWNHLKAISLSTPLNVRNPGQKEPADPTNSCKKWTLGCIDRNLFAIDPRTNIDIIHPFGQKEGCAGMDVNLYIHLIRHWEWRSPKNGEFVDWFIKRAQNQATQLTNYVEERVERLEKNWNSAVSSLLPNDSILFKQKKDAPILSQKAIDAMSGGFRRHYSVRRSLTASTDMKRRSKKPRVVPAPTKLPATNGNLSVENKPENGVKTPKSMLTEKGTRKRTLDQTDLESKEKNMFIRSRFTTREYDMLVLIRGVSFFLNPIHRFWLNPTVMRDVMHEYLPESRCKTVPCLMAAGAREMVRPGRMAQLQYIVKTLASYPSMIELRSKWMEIVFTDEKAKNDYFLNAFRKAHEFIFSETNTIPPIDTTDSEFDNFMKEKKLSVVISGNAASAHVYPRRSKPCQTVDDIHHCVAFNVVMSSLIGNSKESDPNEKGLSFENLVNSVSAKSVTEVLETGRADGLITRMRNVEQTSMMMRNHSTFSIFYRHFFNHNYRNDLVDLVQAGLKDNYFGDGQDENPACVLQLVSQLYSDDYQIGLITPRNVDELIGQNDQTEGKPVTKQLRKLENATLHLDEIKVNVDGYSEEWKRTPSREEIAKIVGPTYPVESEKMKLERQAKSPASKVKVKGVTADKVKKIVDLIRRSEYCGVATEEIAKKLGIPEINILEVLKQLTKHNEVFPCGIDTRRWVMEEFTSPWMMSTKSDRFFIRPWSLPDGNVNWPVLRWMSEGVLMTILYKPGLCLEEMKGTYSYVLQPVLLLEIIEMLEHLGVVKLEKKVVPTIKKKSPFINETVAQTSTHVLPTIYGIERFAAFFVDVPSASQFFKKYDSNFHSKK